MGTCWFTFVPLSVSDALCLFVCPAVSILQAEAAEVTPANTRRWRNAGFGLKSPPAVSTTRPGVIKRSPANTRRWTSAGLMLGQRRRRWASNWPALGQCLVFAVSVDKPQYVSHIGVVPKRNDKFCSIHSLYCPQEPFNNINNKSHWHYIY